MSKASLNCVRISQLKQNQRTNAIHDHGKLNGPSRSNLRSWPGQASLVLDWGNNYNQLIKTEHMKAAATQEECALESGRQGRKDKRNPRSPAWLETIRGCHVRTIIKTFQHKLIKPGVWTQQTEVGLLSVCSGVLVAALVKKHREWRSSYPVLED